jgi:hypothetical protein
VLDAHFVWTFQQHAARAREQEVRHREKWSPNPLQAHPLVAIGKVSSKLAFRKSACSDRRESDPS